MLPSIESITAAYRTVTSSITAAPTDKQKIALIGAMLGGSGIRSTPDINSYISAAGQATLRVRLSVTRSDNVAPHGNYGPKEIGVAP